MNISPSPPTDNLYKFMAISGLWMDVGTIVFFLYLGNLNYKTKIDNSYLQELNEILQTPPWLLITFMSLGIFLTLAGFLLWYVHLQQGQDQLAKIEMELKAAQLEKVKLEIKQLSMSRRLPKR